MGKGEDDRYKKRGDITYKRLYQDNLSQRAKDIVMKEIGTEIVSLYTIEFFGVNKTCNENFNITDISNIKFSQRADKIIEIVQGFLMTFFGFAFLIYEFVSCVKDRRIVPSILYFWFYISYLIISLGFLVSKIVAFVRANKYDGTDDYNCNDSITNELIRVGNENSKKAFTYNKICLFSEVALIGAHILVFIVGLIWYLFDNIIPNYRGNKLNNDYKDYKEDHAVEIPYANYPNYPKDN